MVGMPSTVVQGADWFSRAVDVVECDQEVALASAPQKHVGDTECFVFGSGSAWVGVGLDVQRVHGMFRDGVEAGFSARRHRLRVAQFVTVRRREDEANWWMQASRCGPCSPRSGIHPRGSAGVLTELTNRIIAGQGLC